MIRGQQALPLGSPKQRALLGLFLVHANETITRERLIEELWGDAAPKTVKAVLNVYLSRLRRLLADGTGEQLLLTHAAGYVLRVPPDKLDTHRFEALLEQGRREFEFVRGPVLRGCPVRCTVGRPGWPWRDNIVRARVRC